MLAVRLNGSRELHPTIKALLLHQNSNHFSTWESQQFSQHAGKFSISVKPFVEESLRPMHLFFPAVRIVFRDFMSRKMVFWQQVSPRQRYESQIFGLGMFFKGEFFSKISTNLSFLLVLLVWTSYVGPFFWAEKNQCN